MNLSAEAAPSVIAARQQALVLVTAAIYAKMF